MLLTIRTQKHTQNENMKAKNSKSSLNIAFILSLCIFNIY